MPEMVAALELGLKTQTRRILRVQPESDRTGRWTYIFSSTNKKLSGTWDYSVVDPEGRSFTDRGRERRVVEGFKTPYETDDVLWVRESFLLEELIVNKKENVSKGTIVYQGVKTISGKKEFSVPEALDHNKYFKAQPRFINPRFMPRWASRYDLVVEEVRIQRLRYITEEDAKAEGVSPTFPIYGDSGGYVHEGYRDSFSQLWDKIHGDGAWRLNPLVAAYTFRRIK